VLLRRFSLPDQQTVFLPRTEGSVDTGTGRASQTAKEGS
jgi:hypothetical protein